jgi:hypothetical protein
LLKKSPPFRFKGLLNNLLDVLYVVYPLVHPLKTVLFLIPVRCMFKGGDALGWTVSDLNGIDIFWICAKLFLNVPLAIGGKQVV